MVSGHFHGNTERRENGILMTTTACCSGRRGNHDGTKAKGYRIFHIDKDMNVTTEFREVNGQFSPDGKWVVYEPDESGANEIYVRPFPLSGGRWQVSTAGGKLPQWSSDGGSLFYRSGLDLLEVSVTVKGDSFQAAIPEVILEAQMGEPGFFGDYALDQQGGVFFFSPEDNEAVAEPKTTLVLHWFKELRERSH